MFVIVYVPIHIFYTLVLLRYACVFVFTVTLHFMFVGLGTGGGQCPPGRVDVSRHAAPRSVDRILYSTPLPFWLKAYLNKFFPTHPHLHYVGTWS